MKKIIIVSVSTNNVIGINGKMPWHSSDDLRHFRDTTLNFPVLMGRKTFDSIGKPLEKRVNLVLTKTASHGIRSHPNVEIFNSLESVFTYCESKNFKKIFIIGGSQIFELCMSLADELLISRMNSTAEGDIYFPQINPEIWELISAESRKDFIIQKYVKRF